MTPVCSNCGGPDDGLAVICKFCQRPVSAQVQASAIPCPNPNCRTPNRWGRQQCYACNAWVVVSCVFCGNLSPYTCPACLTCHEPFAGAAERKMQRAYQQDQAQTMQTLEKVGEVAAIFGAAAIMGRNRW